MPDRPQPLPTYPAAGTLADLLEYVRQVRAHADGVEALVVSLGGGPTSLVYPGDELPSKPGEPEIVAPDDRLPPRSAPLTSDATYDTDTRMTSSAFAKQPGPAPASDGPATKLMKELGLSNLGELAAAMGERHVTVRSWNSRDNGLPDRVEPTVKKLRERLRKSRGK